MPAWITSELRELVWVPIASSASRITTSRAASASSRATASPTMPAPTTTTSTRSTGEPPLEDPGPDAGDRRDARHRTRRAIEQRAEQSAEEGGESEADGADQRRGGAGRVREWRERERSGARQDERAAEEEHGERSDHGSPVAHAGPRESRGGEAAEDHECGTRAQKPRRTQAQHEAAPRPCARDLAEHHADEHPAVGADRDAARGEREGRARDPGQDAHLAAQK